MDQLERTMRSRFGRFLGWLLLAMTSGPATQAADSAHRITVLYDAFGPGSGLKMDWGFAALVEYDGKRILFDTGNDREFFAHNVRTLGVDLTRLDAVVISHRHGDHTTGLAHVLETNPNVPVFAPLEGAFFGMVPPRDFYARDPTLPEDLRYFRGQEPAHWRSGTPWENARFEVVRGHVEIAPRIHLISTQSDRPGSREMNELSLVLSTPDGLVVVVGCSHPGVEHIVSAVRSIDPRVHLVTGGFHLVLTRPAEIQRVAELLRDEFGVARVAPGHCTGEIGFSIFLKTFEDRFERAGLGAVLPLP